MNMGSNARARQIEENSRRKANLEEKRRQDEMIKNRNLISDKLKKLFNTYGATIQNSEKIRKENQTKLDALVETIIKPLYESIPVINEAKKQIGCTLSSLTLNIDVGAKEKIQLTPCLTDADAIDISIRITAHSDGSNLEQTKTYHLLNLRQELNSPEKIEGFFKSLGVSEKDLPEFIKNWDQNVRNGVEDEISDILVKKANAEKAKTGASPYLDAFAEFISGTTVSTPTTSVEKFESEQNKPAELED